MTTHRLDTAADRLASGVRAAVLRLRQFGTPERTRRLKTALAALALLWALFALGQLFWSLLPAPDAGPAPTELLNPPGAGAATAASVDIEELAGWDLFGAAIPEQRAEQEVEQRAEQPAEEADVVENTATETRLNLKLLGIAASPDSRLARAIVEIQGRQEQYAVKDRLPLSGNVTLTKILPDRVLLNNGGVVERLSLFEPGELATVATVAAPGTGGTGANSRAETQATRRELDRRGDSDLTALAESFRQRLYSNPQSLSEVVRITAVREDGQLRGYRLSAGPDREQFERLGFRANDIVTGVNGVELTDPGKGMELYRIMRSAEQASFNLLRDGEALTLVVGLSPSSGDAPR